MYKEILIRISILVLCILFFSFKAGDINTQFTGDENFYFQSAKNMLESGDWITPRYYGKPRFQKPILYYWLVAVSFKIFGIDWFGARFPSILSAAIIVLLVYLMSKMFLKRTSISLLSAFILATTFKFFKYARFAIPDMVLLFFITLSLYIFIKLFQEGKNKRLLMLIFFFILSLGTLIKGPIGIIIPLLSIAFFILSSKERLPIKRVDISLGVLLYLAMTLPWFLIMLKVHGADFVWQVWIREIVHRVSYRSDMSQGSPVFIEYLRALPFYIPILIIRFLPWSIFLPKGVFNSFSIAKSSAEERRLPILTLSWFFTVFILFTLLGEKHGQYMLVLTPAFALIVGMSFSPALEISKKRLSLPIALLLITTLLFLFFLANEEFKLNSALIGGFASKIQGYRLDESDRIGLGSHELIPQQLEVYLDRPVEKVGGKWCVSINEVTNRSQLESFFKSKERVFCIISRKDYQLYLLPELKDKLKILHNDFLWKRKIRITKESLFLLFNGKIIPFLNSFKEEYYLVANK